MLHQPNNAGPQQVVFMVEIMTFLSICSVAVCIRRCSIPIPAVFRSLWLGFHSSDSYGYHFRSNPAPQRLQNSPALGMLVQHPG